MPARGLPLAIPVADDDPSCLEILVIIQCYVDCECDATTMLTVAAHLDVCPPCREELDGLRALKAAVRRCSGLTEML